jgi:hypothetical protein
MSNVQAYCIQGTVTIKKPGCHAHPQVPTFYLLPDVQGIVSREHAVKIANGIVNPNNDPNIVPNLSAILVTLMPNSDEDKALAS